MSNQTATHNSGLEFCAYPTRVQDSHTSCKINHSAEIIPCISQLYRNETFSDVTLVVQNTHFPAHRAILAARCDYFRALFYGGMAESCSNVVHLNDINLMAFKSILRYIYTGQIKLSKTKLTLAILGLAHQYNFHSLENALSTYLVHSLCLKNVWSIYDLAIMYDLDDLVAACLRFLDCLAPAPLSDPRFLRLSQTSVERLLSRDSFCASEIEIFRAVCAWLKSSKEVESETKKPHLMSTPESNIDDKLRGESSSENKEGSVSLFIQPKKSSSFEDFDSEKQSLAVDGTDESRAHQMMRKCVRFELMSLTQLLTEVRSSKLVTSEELLDAINQQTNCPTEMPHRGWFFPGINLASRRFGCTLVSGASGTYPYFFVENPLEESNNAKLNIESLISSEPSFCDSGRNEDREDVDSIGGGEEDDTDEEYSEIYRRYQQLNDNDIPVTAMDMTSDEAGRSSNHPHCTNLPRSSLSEDIVWGVDHAASNNPYISLHHADNHRWSNNQQVHHNIRNLAPYGTGIVNASTNSIAATSSTANAVNSKSARWIQPSSRRRVNQHRPPPPHSEHDVVRHSLDDANASIIIRLGKPSIVNTIRMQLWDRDLRSYSYSVDVSLDRSTWHRIVDYRNYMCRSWQTLHFPSRVIHFIRITGTRNTFNRTFHIITFRCLYSENVFQQIDCFMVPNYNVANIDHGAIVLEGVSRNRDALIDGNIRMYDWNSGYTCHQLGNGAIVVQLAQPFLLRSMRFLLWDLDPRTYSYSVYVSNDRLDWKLVRDASQEQCRSWQTITFPLQLVTFIRVVGTYNTANDVFHLVHLECPYPPAETTESDTEAHGEKLLGLTTSVMPEPNNDRGNIVIPLSSRVNQHDSSNDNVGSDEYQSRNSHQSPVIGEITQDRVLRDSDSIRSESSVHDTNDQSNVFRMHYNQRPNTMTTTIADYDLMSDLNTSSPSTTADGGNIALTASTIAVSSTPATTISDQHGMAPVGQDSLPHYSFHHA